MQAGCPFPAIAREAKDDRTPFLGGGSWEPPPLLSPVVSREKVLPRPPFQNFFLIGMGGPRRRIMAGDIGRRTWSMAVPPAARLLWSPACREPWPSCLPRHTAHKKRRRMASFFVRTEARLEEDGGLWGRDPLFAPEEGVPSPQKNIISEPLRRESALMRGGPPPQKHDPPSLNAGPAASGGAWSDGRRPRPGRPRCPGPSLRRAR